MREIQLTQNKVTVVDDCDYSSLIRHRWCASYQRGRWYAVRHDEYGKIVYMHNEILNPPPGMDTDHKDGNGINNYRSNLRTCSRTQNNANSRKRQGTTSRFKGVYKPSARRKWVAIIKKDYYRHHLGCFDSDVEAAKAYNKAAVELFGEFARLNEV